MLLPVRGQRVKIITLFPDKFDNVLASWPPQRKDQTRCLDFGNFGGDDPARVAKDVRAGTAADFPSLLAGRPRADARGPPPGARPRGPYIFWRAHPCPPPAPSGRGGRERGNLCGRGPPRAS